ncbi:MAG TPA: hypothetical protein VG498_13115 [Terriglobales bacterium]|nr:hypothetical protein [Terriglobales bacterium]
MIASPAQFFATTTAVCIALILLTPLSVLGLAVLNTGLARARSAAHTMIAALAIFAVATIMYFVFGFAWQSVAGGPQHIFVLSGKPWGWIAAQPFFLRSIQFDGSPTSLIAVLQIVSVGLAALIPLGAGLERWRLSASLLSTVLLAGWTYPLFAHWVWGGGWLAQLGTNYYLGSGFLDAGGSSTIQAVGGLTALSIAWILRPRKGKYSQGALPAALPGHNVVFAILGCLLALVGWIALNSAGAILFYGIDAGRIVLVVLNTILTCSSSSLTTAAVTKFRLGKPDASLIANGWMGGLAASGAACAFIPPALAMIIGIVAGTIVPLSVELFEAKLAVDDPGGAISSHGIAGLWGILAAGLFARMSLVAGGSGEAGGSGQLLAQVIGIATLIGLVLPLTYSLNWLLNRLYPQRLASEGEWQGIDLHELGGGAYPEFVTRGDDFTSPRD